MYFPLTNEKLIFNIILSLKYFRKKHDRHIYPNHIALGKHGTFGLARSIT